MRCIIFWMSSLRRQLTLLMIWPERKVARAEGERMRRPRRGWRRGGRKGGEGIKPGCSAPWLLHPHLSPPLASHQQYSIIMRFAAIFSAAVVSLGLCAVALPVVNVPKDVTTVASSDDLLARLQSVHTQVQSLAQGIQTKVATGERQESVTADLGTMKSLVADIQPLILGNVGLLVGELLDTVVHLVAAILNIVGDVLHGLDPAYPGVHDLAYGVQGLVGAVQGILVGLVGLLGGVLGIVGGILGGLLGILL
ncbi:hypothetical protein BOTBODRAFT_236846 [Botryobasidium botryosum FD-172 SS1]|uniref:Uncharacterized protein n=1 Tax=Botryobasidium botryosum (strain FD-172 SS1) TaxID=930990 RepID=A0A067MYM6_BOTB1|nr:hypothetical protein BOTBODRAFT_236846 [Botryobasidium botryosum FD-172 SS1]